MPEKVALLTALKAAVAALEVALVHGAETGSNNVKNSVDLTHPDEDNPGNVSQVKVVGMSAEEFRQLRQASGYTQAETARVLGVASRTVTRWEAGRSRIDTWKSADIRFKLRPGAKEWELRHGRLMDKLAGKVDKVSLSDMPTEAQDIPSKPPWVKELGDV